MNLNTATAIAYAIIDGTTRDKALDIAFTISNKASRAFSEYMALPLGSHAANDFRERWVALSAVSDEMLAALTPGPVIR